MNIEMKHSANSGMFGRSLIGAFFRRFLAKFSGPGNKNRTRKKLPLKGDKLAKVMKARFDCYVKGPGQEEQASGSGLRVVTTGKAKVYNLKAVK